MSLYVKILKGKGRAVFSSQAILKDELIESCPVIQINSEDRQQLTATVVANYMFTWDEEKKISVIALGFGCLYNHSSRANARYMMNYAEGTIEIISNREIKDGEEITINYMGDPESTSLTWFEERAIEYFD